MPALEPLATDIDAFRDAVEYRSYVLRNRSGYLEPRPNPALHKQKRQIDSIYPELGVFDGKNCIETFGFLATIRDAFDGQVVSEALVTRALGFFLSEATQKAYQNVFYLGIEDQMRTPPSWPLVVHTLLSRFVTEEILRQEHQAVLYAKIKPGETEIAFDECLHSRTCRCRNVFTKRELVNCFKQGLTDATRYMIENNLSDIGPEIRYDLDHVKA